MQVVEISAFAATLNPRTELLTPNAREEVSQRLLTTHLRPQDTQDRRQMPAINTKLNLRYHVAFGNPAALRLTSVSERIQYVY